MVAELVAGSQITIPEEITNKIGLSVGDRLNVAIHGKKIILAPVGEKPWTAGDIWESDELIPASLVKAAGLENWADEGFAYPSYKSEQNMPSIRPPYQFDSMEGQMWMSDDFDAPLEDFKEYV